LYLQCKGKRKDNVLFCNKCIKQGEKNGKGIPNGGVIEERKKYEYLSYVDVLGSKEKPYTKIMNQMNLTREMVETEASVRGYKLDEKYFKIAKDRINGVNATDGETQEGKK